MLLVSPPVELLRDLAILDLVAADHGLKPIEESLDGMEGAYAGVNDKGRDDQPRPFHQLVLRFLHLLVDETRSLAQAQHPSKICVNVIIA